MGRGIVKIGDWYFVWSSVCDAPASMGMTLIEASHGLKPSVRRRLEEIGTTYLDLTKEQLQRFAAFNRAGPNEICLTHDQLIEAYALKQSIQIKNDRWSIDSMSMRWTKSATPV